MFDENIYVQIFEALRAILAQNMNSLGQQFCNQVLAEYDPRNGQQAAANARHLYKYIVDRTYQTNGSDRINDNQQLFAFVSEYAREIVANAQRQQAQSRPMGGGYGGGGMSFGNNGGMSMGGGMFGNRQQGGMFNQQSRMAPAAHLADDTVTSTPTAQAQPMTAPPMAAAAPVSIVTPVDVKMVPNPLDDLPDQGVSFTPVDSRPIWGDERPKDNRIVVVRRDDLKTPEGRFTIAQMGGYHQLLLDNPMQVVRDFFDVAPDSLLSQLFMFRIGYTHLKVIDVPTDDFVAFRNKCAEAMQQEDQPILYKKILDALNTMSMGSGRALSQYLVEHINRALYLAVRVSEKPNVVIRLKQFDDLQELFSPGFKHRFTSQPEWRRTMERIVGVAIWNAIGLNTDVMFTDGTIPTHTLQTSPAFPYSMNNVYPSKFAIPVDSEENAEKFLAKLREHELSKRAYILSRRSVTITNILGGKVLPRIGSEPTVVDGTAASLLKMMALPYANIDTSQQNRATKIDYFLSEDNPADQLEGYYNNPQGEDGATIERIKRPAVYLPADQTIFAVQYGVKPEDYLMALDTFSTLDQSIQQGPTILAKRKTPTITPSA